MCSRDGRHSGLDLVPRYPGTRCGPSQTAESSGVAVGSLPRVSVNPLARLCRRSSAIPRRLTCLWCARRSAMNGSPGLDRRPTVDARRGDRVRAPGMTTAKDSCARLMCSRATAPGLLASSRLVAKRIAGCGLIATTPFMGLKPRASAGAAPSASTRSEPTRIFASAATDHMSTFATPTPPDRSDSGRATMR